MRKKGILDVLVRSVMILYEGARTKVTMDSELWEEFDGNVGRHLESVMLPFFAAVVDFVSELARDCMLSELLYADNLVLISETIEGNRNKFIKWKVFKSKSQKADLEKANVTICGGIARQGLSKNTVIYCSVWG